MEQASTHAPHGFALSSTSRVFGFARAAQRTASLEPLFLLSCNHSMIPLSAFVVAFV